MKVKTAELTGAALDLAVSRASNPKGRDGCGGFERDAEGFLFDPLNECRYSPSTDWAQGGPIIERESITIICAEVFDSDCKGLWRKLWAAEQGGQHSPYECYEDQHYAPRYEIDASSCCYGPTPLIAAMRCYVASKLGAEIEIPDELK